MGSRRKARGPRPTAALAVLVLAATASATERGPLAGDAIRELIVGNTLIGPYYGSLYDFSYEAGGDVYGSTGAGTDGGRWRIRDGGLYCHAWSTLFDAEERCYRWYDAGGGRYRLENVDAYRSYDLHVWRIRPGTGD